MKGIKERISERLEKIYPGKISEEFEEALFSLLEKNKKGTTKTSWSEKDSFVITYGDSLQKQGQTSLNVLHQFANTHFKDVISTVHILPFFPYSSDDGFSVIDFEAVNPDLGDWEDVQELSKDFKLMFDLVINHVSSQSEWFRQFLNNEAPGKDYVLVPPKGFDTSNVIRPRSTPVLTSYTTKNGEQEVWTTFSADQIDLNYWNPELLLEMIRIFLLYVEKGASVIRLDAIAFLWKRMGSTCLHEDETHEIVKIFRDVVDYCCPDVVLLTETNVPHKENISYFGIGDEAQMVYQFPLPPLLLYTLNKGNATFFKTWLANLEMPAEGMTFFNFTASHDGIGVRPLEGLMPDSEKIALAEDMKAFGGKVNTRRTPEGLDVPYELNITYFDALKGSHEGIDNFQAERFICSQMVMMSLQGVPAFYIHSLLATPNYDEGVQKTKQNRTINRRKFTLEELDQQLGEGSVQKSIFETLLQRIALRRTYAAFHPNSAQALVESDDDMIVLERGEKQSEDSLLAVFNVSNKTKSFKITSAHNFDIITETFLGSELTLTPYQCLWLIKK